MLFFFKLKINQIIWISPAIEIEKLRILDTKIFSDVKLKKIISTEISVKFKIIGVNAIAANFPRVFKYDPAKDVRQIKRTNGKDNLEKFIVIKNLSGFFENPGAIKLMMRGIKISNTINSKNKKTRRPEKTLEKNSFALFLPDFVKTPDTIGIKAEFIAPSANNLLNKLGSLKATKNASDIKPAPITLAIRRSLA